MRNVVLILVGFSAQALAQVEGTLVCQTKVLSSICGTGEVKIRINNNDHFYLSNGDTGCWATSFDFSGQSVAVSDRRLIRPDNKLFDLVAYPDSFVADIPLPAKIGDVEINKTQNLAKLTLNPHYFPAPYATGHIYHLSCENRN